MNLSKHHPCSEMTPAPPLTGDSCPLGIGNFETWPRAAWIDLEKHEMEETQLSFCWEEAGSMALVQAAQGTHS